MKAPRKKIPDDLDLRIRSRSGNTCCVCQRSVRTQIHHIDKDPSNNAEGNLALLCLRCHDEAHPEKRLTKDLTPKLVRGFKAAWEATVETRFRDRFSTRSHDQLDVRIWTYFNFTLLLQLSHQNRTSTLKRLCFQRASAQGLISGEGFPLPGRKRKSALTIFDSMDAQDAHLVQAAFSELLEDLIGTAQPTDLARFWSKSIIRRLAAQGQVIALNRGFHFITRARVGNQDQRFVYCQKAGIRLQFQIDPWNIYSSSAFGSHFVGHSRVAAILVLRSAEYEEVNGKAILIVKATPLALGSGFMPDQELKPAIAWQREGDLDGEYREEDQGEL